MINELRSRKAYKELAQGFNHISAKIKCPRRAREAHNGRAKTSAHLVAAPFRTASPCAGFEPCPSIDLVMKTFEFRKSRLAVAGRIFIVAFAASKAPPKSKSTRMQNRRQPKWRGGSEIGSHSGELAMTEGWLFLK